MPLKRGMARVTLVHSVKPLPHHAIVLWNWMELGKIEGNQPDQGINRCRLLRAIRFVNGPRDTFSSICSSKDGVCARGRSCLCRGLL